jgi:hypothetical protein
MAGLVPAIHEFLPFHGEHVDARDKPGHDACAVARVLLLLTASPPLW